MPKKISPNDMRSWLDRYDSGESEIAIARAEKKDTRTVKKWLAKARREREARGVRVELVKYALKQHQDRLLKFIKEVESALVMPFKGPWRGYDQKTLPSELGFVGTTLIYTKEDSWRVHLAVEDKPEWELVKEHLKGDSMWTSLNAWKKSFESYVEAGVNLEAKCAGVLRTNNLQEPYFLDNRITFVFIYQAVLYKALGNEPGKEFEEIIQIDKDKGELTAGLKWGSKPVLAKVPGQEESCKADFLDALEDLIESEETRKVRLTYRELEDAIKKARRDINDILLLEMVQGECRACRRLTE
jgi:hypothetical protein